MKLDNKKHRQQSLRLDGAHLPTLDGAAIAVGRVHDAQAALLGSEQQVYESADAQSRKVQFASGRQCVRNCQSLLGVPRFEVPHAGRMPQWPSSWRGSISHTQHLAAAVMTSTSLSPGIDLEEVGRAEAKPQLAKRLFTDQERAHLGSLGYESAQSVAFSAKEAGYKAIYPLVGEYIGFQEVSVTLSLAPQTFRFTYHGNNPGNIALESGLGYWQILDGHVLSLFLLDC